MTASDDVAPGTPAPRSEVWVRASPLLLAGTLLAYLLLGMRPGGRLAIWTFHQGRVLLAVSATLVLVLGVAASLRRRPFLQGRRGRGFVLLLLAVGLAQWPLPYPSSREDRPSSVVFRLPVEGEWVVVHGGEGRAANLYSVLTHDRRFGLVLVRAEEGATRRAGSGPEFDPQDFLAWGEPVLAPADGEVVAVRDGLPDGATPSGHGDGPPSGNSVVIRVAEGEYLFLTHLLAGSIEVREGERVVAGRRVARVGFSGRPLLVREPHLAAHLQTTAEEHWGEGVPWEFRGYAADGLAVKRGIPRGGLRGGRPAGQRVRSLDGS